MPSQPANASMLSTCCLCLFIMPCSTMAAVCHSFTIILIACWFTFDSWSRKRVTVRLGWRNVAMSNFQQSDCYHVSVQGPIWCHSRVHLGPPPPPLGALIAFAMKFGQPDRYTKPTCQCIDDSVCNEVWSAWPICQANLPMHRCSPHVAFAFSSCPAAPWLQCTIRSPSSSLQAGLLFWSRKRVTVRLGWRSVAMSNIYIYIYIEIPLFVDYIQNPSKSTLVICSNQLFFLATPPIVWL